MTGTTLPLFRRVRFPANLHLLKVRHVGHGAAGVQVRENHRLVIAAQNVGALCHEVYAAEDDVLGLRAVGGEL